MVTRTQILERHIRALGRAKAIEQPPLGKGGTSAAGVIIGEDDLLVAKSKTSMLAKEEAYLLLFPRMECVRRTHPSDSRYTH